MVLRHWRHLELGHLRRSVQLHCRPCQPSNFPYDSQALQHRTDSKLYRVLLPQTPIARTRLYDRHGMDEFPNGTNMMVAVLAYTCAPQPQLSCVIVVQW